jgi:hypothetical protein
MKCKKNDQVLLKNGKWCRVVKGTNIEKGWVTVIERFPEIGWTQDTTHNASEIVDVKKWKRA